MDFLTLLRALDLEPVNDSVIVKMIDSVVFQGHRIDLKEMGHELTEALVRLISDDNKSVEVGEGARTVELFRDVKLPELNQNQYVLRKLEHKVVLLTKSGSSWKSLERELKRRMRKGNRNEHGAGEWAREIFAVSWSGSSDGGNDGQVRVNTNNHQNEKKINIESSDESDGEILKASELIKWLDGQDGKYNVKGYEPMDVVSNCFEGEHENETMDVDEQDEENKRLMEEIMRNFVNPKMKSSPSQTAKVRLIELDNFENPDVQFADLYTKAKDFTVHWLQAFPGGGFIWKKTYGPLKFSRMKLTPISYQEDKWFPYLEHKAWQNIICICGVAGMGKTTFLTHMAYELKRKYKNRLVCFINLKQFSDLLEAMHVKKLNMILFADLILKYLNIDQDLDRNDWNIFKTAINMLEGSRMEPKVELLMDGLDRMSQKGRQLLLDYLEAEMALFENWSSFRVWITTKPHLKYGIEQAFSIVSYDLEALSSADVMDYFGMQDDLSDFDHSFKIRKVAHSLFSPSLKSYLKIDVRGLLAPAERMCAFQTFMKLNDYPSPFKLNATLIMKQIIMPNVKNYYIKSFLDDDPTLSKEDKVNKVDDILRKYIPLAICACSGGNGRPTGAIYWTEDETNLEDKKDLLDFGLVTTKKDGKVLFIHPAYPAYILAEYYLNYLPDHTINLDFFLNNILARDGCDLIRQFYDEGFVLGVKEHIFSSWSDLLRTFLIKTYFLSNNDFDHDHVQTTTNVLQLAIIDKRLNLAKLLLWSFSQNYHLLECQRLIKRKVLARISDVGKTNCKSYSKKFNPISGGYHHVELSSLSLAILFGDRELVHSMYQILGKEGDAHIQTFSSADHFHYSPLHLSVIGCNQMSFSYLCRERHMSPNKQDNRGHLPLHLIFYNRWILKFPSIELGNVDVESDIIREVHICKYYEDQLDPEWNERIGQLPDRAGHLPLLASRFVQSYMRIQMKEGENFQHKRISQPWKICYYRSYVSYRDLTISLCGRTLINFKKKVKKEFGVVRPPFHFACSQGYLPVIKAMLEKNVNLNIKDKHNRTALYVALCKQNMHVVQYLMEQGINRDDSQLINGLPLLHYVAVQNFAPAVAYLVQELKVPVDQRAKEGDNCTALHMACFAGCLEAAKKLIELGADVNSKDDEDYTPLLHATQENSNTNLKVVKLLIEKGADLTAVCEGGKTCLHLAMIAGREKETRLSLVQLLLDHTQGLLDINGVNSGGQSPLHFACEKEGNIDILKILVEYGANVNLQDHEGRSPLNIFCSDNGTDTAMALYLINQKVNIFQVNNAGQNSLNLLSERNPSLVKLMYSAWKSNLTDSIKARIDDVVEGSDDIEQD